MGAGGRGYPAADKLFTADTTIQDAHAPFDVTFTINGESVTAPVDRTTGVATATVPTVDVPVGPGYPVEVSFAGDDFLAPTSTIGNIDFKGASVTTYTGDTAAFWDDDATVSATVTDGTPSGLGDPVDHGTVTFALGSSVSPPIPVDSNGVASTTLHVVDDPGLSPQIVATFTEDPDVDAYNSSATSVNFTTKKRPTTLTYTGDTAGKYNSQATLSAQLLDTATGDPLVGSGENVAFKLGDGDAVTAHTDPAGNASVTVPIKSKVGTYPLDVDFFGSSRYVASHDMVDFLADFQYKFTDTLIGNSHSALLNPDTQQVGFERKNGHRSRIAPKSYQLSLYLPTVVRYPESGLPSLELPEEWNILNLPRLSDLFGLVGSPPGTGPLPAISTEPPAVPPVTPPDPGTLPVAIPELPVPIPMMASSSSRASSNSGIVLPNLAGGSGTPVPTGGMTIGELIEAVSNSGIPTSLSACELLSGSTCERRFIIAATVLHDGGPDIVGVFDVTNGLFASLVSNTTGGPALLASLGTCTTTPALCIGQPAFDLAVPPPVPVLPNPAGLAAAIEGLAAQLQSLPSQITAPPVPPAPEAPATGSSAAPAPVSVGALLPSGNALATLIPTYWLG